MADPPPKKVGSLRDRIAAFENKATTPASAPAPAPRPKPTGHVSWKPRTSSPPPPAVDEPQAQPEKKVGAGMSAADAKASIGAGGSLRERMAALQGRGGFGGAAPPVAPPKPATDKPKWKPPPKVISPPPDEDEQKASTDEHALSEEQEPKPVHEGDEEKEEEPKQKEEAAEEGAQSQEPDPEEEERQRRAAIAARMARLGGARVGMSPPIFGKKPDVPKKPSTPKVEEPKEEGHKESAKDETPASPPAEAQRDIQASPAIPTDVRSPGSTSEQEYFDQTNTSSTSLLSAGSASTSQPRSPAMPVPAAPRRAAPPRRKAPKSPSPAAPNVVEDAALVAESPTPGTPQLTYDDTSKELQEAVHKSKEDEIELGLPPVTQPPAIVHEVSGKEAEQPVKVSEKPAEEERTAVDEETHEEDSVRVIQDNLDELALDNEKEHVQAEPAEPSIEPATAHEEPEAQPEPERSADTAEPEEEEDEDERRKRIADRLRQQGGFNPFTAPPPPVRRPSEHEHEREQEAPSRKTSIDVPQDKVVVVEPQQEQDEEEEHVAIPEVVRRQSTNSVAGSLKSPVSPPPPSASARPDVPVRRDSHLSTSSAHKVDEAEQESLDDSRNAHIFNDHTIDELDEEARLADVHAESEEYVDAPEEQEQPPFVHDEGVPVLDEPEPESKRTSVPLPPRSVSSHPAPAADEEEVYDERDIPPPPPQRTSIPPPPRTLPAPPAADEEQVYDESEEVPPPPPPPRRTSIPPTARVVPPPPPQTVSYDDFEADEDDHDDVPPSPPRRTTSIPPPHSVPPPPPPAVSHDESEEDEDVPPPPPRRTSVPAPRSMPPPPPPVASYADDTNEYDYAHGQASSPPTSPRVHPAHRAGPPPPPPMPEAAYEDDEQSGSPLDERPPVALPPRPETPEDEATGLAYVDEPEEELAPSQPEPVLTEEEEEAERRKRIAERLRQQGGFNPFGAPRPPPVRKATRPTEVDTAAPERRESVELPRSPPPPVRRATRPSVEEVPAPERQASVETSRSPASPAVLAEPAHPPPPPPMQPTPEDEAVDDDGSQYSGDEALEAEEEVPPPPPPPRHASLPVVHPQHPAASPVQAPPAVKLPKREDHEVLDDEDGDPIDPSFYKLQRSPSSATVPANQEPEEPQAIQEEPEHAAPATEPEPEPQVEDEESARKRTIAERMAKLGGIRFGAPPPVMRPPPPPPPPAADDESDDHDRPEEEEEPQVQPAEEEEEDEFARKQRIAARLASMGGMRFGMFPTPAAPPSAPAPKSPRVPSEPEVEELHDAPPPLPPSRPPPPRAAPPPPAPQPPAEHSDVESEGYSQVEAEESEMEEVYHPDEEEEAPPPVPTRPAHRVSAVPEGSSMPRSPSFRPPIPTARPPAPLATRPPMSTTPSDFVMVEAPDDSEEIPPPPPPRTVSLKKGPSSRTAPLPSPPPPAPADTPSQWENTLDFGGETDLSLSGQWSEDSTHYPAQQREPSGSSNAVPPPVPAKLTADDLVAHWGRVGVQIHEVAITLYERSKRTLIGDGTFVGFVTTVLDEVPTAAKPIPPYSSFGYLIYEQVGPSVHVRVSDILPGDVIVLHDAKLKGHKGLQIYHQNVGTTEPVCAIIGDYETKKAKVKVFQANQHVGQQSVESVSYRLEDLKSGTVKIFRVLEG